MYINRKKSAFGNEIPVLYNESLWTTRVVNVQNSSLVVKHFNKKQLSPNHNTRRIYLPFKLEECCVAQVKVCMVFRQPDFRVLIKQGSE